MRGLEYLHSRNILHLDVKGANVLIFDGEPDGSHRYTAKLADFGFASVKSESATLQTGRAGGTFNWRAPESFEGRKLTKASDMYSAACTLYELAACAIPWAGEHEAGIYGKVSGGRRPDRPENCPKEFWTVIEGGWRHKPEERSSVARALRALELGGGMRRRSSTEIKLPSRRRKWWCCFSSMPLPTSSQPPSPSSSSADLPAFLPETPKSPPTPQSHRPVDPEKIQAIRNKANRLAIRRGDDTIRKTVDSLLDNNTDFWSASIESPKLDDEDAYILADILRLSHSVRSIWLWFNTFTDVGFHAILDALKVNESVTDMDLSSNPYGAKCMEALTSMLRVNKTLTALSITGVALGSRGAERVAMALRANSTLTDLDIGDNGIDSEGAVAIAKMLSNNNSVAKLVLAVNDIDSIGAKAIAVALSKSVTLTELNLSRNSIGTTGAQEIALALNNNVTLKELNLIGNGIDAQGAKSIAVLLKLNQTLTDLYINRNPVADTGAAALADALSCNNVLSVLWMEDCQIGDEGASALANALQANSSLKILQLKHNQSISDYGKVAIKRAKQADLKCDLFAEEENAEEEQVSNPVAEEEQVSNPVGKLMPLIAVLGVPLLWTTRRHVNLTSAAIFKGGKAVASKGGGAVIRSGTATVSAFGKGRIAVRSVASKGCRAVVGCVTATVSTVGKGSNAVRSVASKGCKAVVRSGNATVSAITGKGSTGVRARARQLAPLLPGLAAIRVVVKVFHRLAWRRAHKEIKVQLELLVAKLQAGMPLTDEEMAMVKRHLTLANRSYTNRSYVYEGSSDEDIYHGEGSSNEDDEGSADEHPKPQCTQQ